MPLLLSIKRKRPKKNVPLYEPREPCHPPRHLKIQPPHTIGPINDAGRMKHMSADEFQHL